MDISSFGVRLHCTPYESIFSVSTITAVSWKTKTKMQHMRQQQVTNDFRMRVRVKSDDKNIIQHVLLQAHPLQHLFYLLALSIMRRIVIHFNCISFYFFFNNISGERSLLFYMYMRWEHLAGWLSWNESGKHKIYLNKHETKCVYLSMVDYHSLENMDQCELEWRP